MSASSRSVSKLSVRESSTWFESLWYSASVSGEAVYLAVGCATHRDELNHRLGTSESRCEIALGAMLPVRWIACVARSATVVERNGTDRAAVE